MFMYRTEKDETFVGQKFVNGRNIGVRVEGCDRQAS
jgi:hypothetical protein